MSNMFKSVCISNIIGIVLMLMVLITNRGLYLKGQRFANLKRMIAVSISACLSDIIAYAIDGKTETVLLIISYIVNSWLYFAVIMTAYFWIKLLCDHIGVDVPDAVKIVFTIIDSVCAIVLVLNAFYPIVFHVDGEGFYQRDGLYWIFVVAGGINILCGIVLYLLSKRKGEMLVTFSVSIFAIPITAAIVVQSLFYGISVVWVGVSIAIVGLIASLKNELIYIDQLTEIYNRYYLEKWKKDISRKKKLEITGIMADLDNFKAINDEWGHRIGDEALIETARILSKAVDKHGKAIRYSGDEFIIIIKSADKAVVSEIINAINKGFEDFNYANPTRYKLSISMGYDTFNLKDKSIDEFINIIDAKMYANKKLRKSEL